MRGSSRRKTFLRVQFQERDAARIMQQTGKRNTHDDLDDSKLRGRQKTRRHLQKEKLSEYCTVLCTKPGRDERRSGEARVEDRGLWKRASQSPNAHPCAHQHMGHTTRWAVAKCHDLVPHRRCTVGYNTIVIEGTVGRVTSSPYQRMRDMTRTPPVSESVSAQSTPALTSKANRLGLAFPYPLPRSSETWQVESLTCGAARRSAVARQG